MNRIDGPSMGDAMTKRPRTHPTPDPSLAAISTTSSTISCLRTWLSPWADGGDRIIHLDLHPLNVLMSRRGPVVIDWSNAAPGDPLTDVASDLRAARAARRSPVSRLMQLAINPPAPPGPAVSSGATVAPSSTRVSPSPRRSSPFDPNMSPDEIEAFHPSPRSSTRRTSRSTASEPQNLVPRPGRPSQAAGAGMVRLRFTIKTPLRSPLVGDSGSGSGRAGPCGSPSPSQSSNRVLRPPPDHVAVPSRASGSCSATTSPSSMRDPEPVVAAVARVGERPAFLAFSRIDLAHAERDRALDLRGLGPTGDEQDRRRDHQPDHEDAERREDQHPGVAPAS